MTIHTTRRIEVAGVLGPETTFRRLVPGRLTSSSDAVDATRDLLIRERADELHLPSPTFNPTKIPDRSVLKMHGADPRERSTDPPAEELVDQGRQGAGRRTLGGASVPTIAALNGSPFNHIHDAKRAIVETIKEKPLGDAVTLVNLNCEAVPAKR